MSLAEAAPRRWRKPPFIERAWLRWTLLLGAGLYLAVALGTTEVNWVRVWEGLPRGARFIAAFFPPDFSSRWGDIACGADDFPGTGALRVELQRVTQLSSGSSESSSRM